jgi:hypothetical protein
VDAPPVAERRDVTEIALFAGVVLLYGFTFSRAPAADGYWYLDLIDKQRYKDMLNPTSPGTQVLMYGLRRLLDSMRVPVSTLGLIQGVNAAVAGAGVVVFYRTLRTLGGWLPSVVGAALLTASFGYWYFINGERQHPSLLILLIIFYWLTRARVDGADFSWRIVAVLGVLNALAVALRQENFLFGVAAVALLTVGRPCRAGVRDAAIYAVSGAVGTLVFAALLALCGVGFGVYRFGEYLRYYFGGWLVDSVGSGQDYQGFEHATRFDVPRMIKGQLTAFVAGTQVVFDVARGLVSLSHRKVASLAALTALAGLLMLILSSDVWRARRLIRGPHLAAAIGCLAWLAAYAVLHAMFWPTVTKYHVVTLPPLVLLLMLGALAAPAANDDAASWWRTGAWRALALVLVVFTINVWAGIRPGYQYGQMKARLIAIAARDFRPSDLFISTESGLDRVFDDQVGEHIYVKNALLKTTDDEVFGAITEAIRERLEQRHRVFVYNFVPSPYSLIGINQAPTRGPRPLNARDFETFFAGLQKTYTTRQVFAYWEEGKAPLYLFGERLEPFWELAK